MAAEPTRPETATGIRFQMLITHRVVASMRKETLVRYAYDRLEGEENVRECNSRKGTESRALWYLLWSASIYAIVCEWTYL